MAGREAWDLDANMEAPSDWLERIKAMPVEAPIHITARINETHVFDSIQQAGKAIIQQIIEHNHKNHNACD